MAPDLRSSARGERRFAGASRRVASCLRLSLFAAVLAASPCKAADQVRISRLSDVGFGSITNFAADLVRSEDVCLFSKSPPANNYRITASGSGAGGAFLLASGGSTMPFEVQWADQPGQASGTQLLANQAATGRHTTTGPSDPDDCSRGPAATASLIIILRSSALAAASSGNYTGALTLLVAPE